MITEADAELESWIASVVEPATVSAGPPITGAQGSGISLHLVALAAYPALRGARRPPIQAKLRYLVTAWGQTTAEAHRLLDAVLLAAEQRDGVDVELEVLDGATWLAMGVRPQAAFVLVVPVRQDIPRAAQATVRADPEVHLGVMGSLDGVVLGDGDIPVAGAEVVLASPRRTAWTDRRGRFHLAGVPVGAAALTLEVSARGRSTTVEASGSPESDEPFIVRIELLEASDG